MAGNRLDPGLVAEPLRDVLEAAREVAALEAGNSRALCAAHDDLDHAVGRLVSWCRSVMAGLS